MKKIHALSLMVLPAVLVACGGGEPKAPSPAPAAAPSAPAAAPAAPVKGTASVTGTVAFQGQAPKAEAISMNADPACQKAHSGTVYGDTVVVNDNGTLRNVFVHVKAGLEGKQYPVPSEPVVVDQMGCRYSPHVLGMMAGQTLKILNSDDTLHNVHALPSKNEQFNIAMPKFMKEKEVTFKTPETMIKVKCEVHPWMSAWIGVLDHPYFSVSGETGAFSLDELPAGTYTVEAWHEKYGTQTQEVTVGDGEAKEIAFTFTAQ